jgi:hypothetical protein
LTVTGTPGQATTGNTGQAASAGADLSITAGIGGAAPAGSANGRGGMVYISPGAPGAGTGTASAYGNVLIASSGGRVGVGTTTPTALIDVTGTQATFASTRIAAGNAPVLYTIRKANTGTTAVANGHEIANWTFAGYDGSMYIAGSRIRAVVDGTVSAGIVPIAIAFSTGENALLGDDGTVRSDENASVERLRITSSGNIGINMPSPTSKLHVNGGVQVGVPTGGDMGIGTINVAGDIYKDGTPYTNPDYVFEHHFNGSTEADYSGPLPLAELEEAIKTHGQLPGIGRQPLGVFGRQDVLLEKLEEAYLYIIELTKRVDRLEAQAALTRNAEQG